MNQANRSRNNPDIVQMSNELEFCLSDICAARLVDTGLVVHEVNPHDIVELNVSLHKDIRDLNADVREKVSQLQGVAAKHGGFIYGGSSLLKDVSTVSPRRYRTTSLSESCARGFLDIASQQIVIGVNDENLGFELYDIYRRISPVLIALSGSSPYVLSGSELKDVGHVSRRIAQYEQLCRHFPEEMWRNMPPINSLDQYHAQIQNISDLVNGRLNSGQLDTNHDELYRVRPLGKQTGSYAPFDRLEPHQIYWFVRIRPDHSNIESGGPSVMSLELRAPDMPTTIERMQMINSLAIGLGYAFTDDRALAKNMTRGLTGEFGQLALAARSGLDAVVSSQNDTMMEARTFGEISIELGRYAVRGLNNRGFCYEAMRLERRVAETIARGNDATILRTQNFSSPIQMRSYLASRLSTGDSFSI